jgi:8-oxo-dGTP pyrophosphatase MutT (NUDIX family)
MVGDQKIVNDWIFMEERDAVNVAVITQEGKFLAFKQRKYAIPGETLAPVGGFINNGEAPFDAARREVWEELGVGSKRTKEILKNGGSLEHSKESNESPFGEATAQVQQDEHGLLLGNVSHDEGDSLGYFWGSTVHHGESGRWIHLHLFTQGCSATSGRRRDLGVYKSPRFGSSTTDFPLARGTTGCSHARSLSRG